MAEDDTQNNDSQNNDHSSTDEQAVGTTDNNPSPEINLDEIANRISKKIDNELQSLKDNLINQISNQLQTLSEEEIKKEFTKDGNNTQKSYLTGLIMILTTIFTIAAISVSPYLYDEVIKNSKTYVKLPKKIRLSHPTPTWFCYHGDSISTTRALDDSDVNNLKALISEDADNYDVYLNGIGKLAYDSNTNTKNTYFLIFLTLCFVFMGCSARTIYDFIGNKCYLGVQDMNKWWPWYTFRPLLCAPIAALLIVAIRTSFFSNIFTSKDLNTYLVISFIAGFAMMDFLKMLRRLSKSLFDGDSRPQ